MDRTGIIVIAICAVLLGVWFVHEMQVEKQMAQAQAAWAATNQVAQAQNTMTGTNGTVTTASGVPGVVPANPLPISFDTNAPEQILAMTNGAARYTFTSRGGGLKLIELLKYPETISPRWRGEVHKEGAVSSLNTRAPLAAMTVLGDSRLTGDGNFTLTPTATGVRAEKTLADGLVMTKDFSFSSNYLVNASVSIRNTSGETEPLPYQEYVIGTATPMDPDDTAMAWGTTYYDGTNSTIEPLMIFTGGGFGCSHREPRPEITTSGNIVWAAANNQFFALLAMPDHPATQLVARTVTLPRFQDGTNDANVAAPQGVQTSLIYPAQSLAAGAAVTRQFTLYAGPKEFRTLQALAEKYNNHADEVMNFGSGFSSFYGIGTFFAKLLLSAMNTLHDWTNIGYGWLIVIITLMIRMAFWPLTAISLRSSKKMAALQPEIAALKEKYKDDQAKFAEKQMELWKKNGVNPMSGCLPAFVQMPVFMGFFTMIRSAIELRGASFLWAADLSKPDTIFMIPGITFLPFNLSTPEGLPLNVLPLLMVGVMVWQAHLQPPSPGMDPGQQKLMRYIPLMFLLIFYNYSSGMSLYMMVSTLVGIVQTKLTKVAMGAPAATPALTPARKSKK